MWRILDSRVVLPRLFIKGRYIGGADAVVTLHEQGKLLQLLEGLPRDQSTSPCDGCGGMCFILCYNCNGSRKISPDGSDDGLSVQCPQCNENGLLLLYHWHPRDVNGILTSILVFLYYFIGSSVPSAYVLWIMRELPPAFAVDSERQSSIVTFMSDTTVAMHNSQRWTSATSSQNQVLHASRASPI
ncbi:hypothetical protein IFM89_011810 [Coptis chinensis]|uniref:Glutaredoxin domain-containing protein n=1 Tax=Coptis chinensis TaxID=261450 RepID=A0A835LEU0_9MAGN|nr:hypothetical protein IFM89_011810 [Coptis chinensis]